jgi:hypothetical protein
VPLPSTLAADASAEFRAVVDVLTVLAEAGCLRG